MLLAPAFLLGLLAIGMPLWLHRVARANPTRHQFASLMLLQASETQRTARRRLRYWLLLSTRILLLLALVLAFAGPLLPARILPKASSQVRLHAIVLDASLSMQYDTRWSRALQAAEAVLDGLHSPDRVMLVTAAGRHINVIHGATSVADAGALRTSLRQLKPGIERLDYGVAMSTAGNWLGSPRPAVVMHLISDAQRSATPLRFADLEPPADAQLIVHDVAAARPAENVFVESTTLLGAADRHDLQVTIRSTAARPLRREASLLIDGRAVARRGIEIPAANVQAPAPGGEGEGAGGPASDISPANAQDTPASTTLAFTDLKLAPGTHRIEVALQPADALPQDDRFRAVVQHASPKVLLISAAADDAAYFAAAIGSLSSPRLAVEQRTVNAVSSDALTGYSLVVIADAAALSNTAASRLEQYVATGGAILATLGAGAGATSTPLLKGWRIGEARPRTSKVGEIASSHPVLREADDWHHVRFFRQRSVSPASEDEVLIAHDDGTPLLIEHRTGAGRMLVLAQPIAREWNDVAIHPLFVRFVAEAARYLAGGAAEAASTTIGSTVLTGLPASGGGQIFDPRGARVLALAQSAAVDRLVPDQLGFYEIRGNDGARWIAVNADTRESDLAALPAPFIQRWQAMRVRNAASAVVTAREQVSPRSLGPILMWLAAALMLAELLLANGHLAIRREVPR